MCERALDRQHGITREVDKRKGPSPGLGLGLIRCANWVDPGGIGLTILGKCWVGIGFG